MKRVIMIKVEGFSKAKQLLTRKIFPPAAFAESGISEEVERIITEVRDKGDKALFDYTKELDGVELSSLEVSKEEISDAYNMVDTKLVSALKLAAKRIRDFHLACKHKNGIIPIDKYLGQQIRPLDRVGLYIPGGTAVYPSTVLMTAIPAKVAGVKEIIMASPPGRSGNIPAPTLVAADIAEVNRIFKIGGAQAIAALAFGTESIPKVNKICGPGNIFVTLAKKIVYGTVGIDGLQGPSEIMIVADGKADPRLCAADLLAQG